LCTRYRKSKVIYVHGNHEFYGSGRARVLAATAEAAKRNRNLVWLDCAHVELDGRRFLGAPLWFRDDARARPLQHEMSDFMEIRRFQSWVYVENERAITFLEDNVGPEDIVITHHLPSQRCVGDRYVGHPLNPFFVCDMEPLIEERRPKIWLHGHTHESVRTRVGATQIVCNPFGYVGHELNSRFVDRLILDV
jgi:hypothetical protein